MSKDELENIALESTRTIDIDEFVPKSGIDPRCLIRPYYLEPDGKVGHDAFAVIRETIRSMDMVAIGRVVLTSREHIIGLEPLNKGLMGTLIRYPYEVRDEHEYFDEIHDVKLTKDMLDLARHIVNQKTADFEPEKFEDHYEEALTELINAKRNGRMIAAKPRPRADNVVNLMVWTRSGRASPAKHQAKARNCGREPRGKRKCFCPSKESAEPRRRWPRPNERLGGERLGRPLPWQKIPSLNVLLTGSLAEPRRSQNFRVRANSLINGAPGTIRTSDPQIRSLMLYPAELRARFREIMWAEPPAGMPNRSDKARERAL
jgi:DNA end-binding protein Ku